MTGRRTSSSKKPRSAIAFDGYFGWHYPPPFLFVAAALSLLSYRAAYAVWVFGTFPVYLAAIRAIIGDRTGYLLAAAFPAVLEQFHRRPERLSHRGHDRRRAVSAGTRPIAAGVLIGF